ncbi:iduronate 2-sulfatase-like [Oscarella lobularis]|uniref:iduronate 2-sulfatase-like n=1 Tax=Oscarella lobularis TaxID=121494 RepID=UPI00331410F1
MLGRVFAALAAFCLLSRGLATKKNVLFIAIDDLRPELGSYGSLQAKSPHIDALANKSMLFERAYCQVAVCSPSRTSFLTGRRPDTNRVWANVPSEYWRRFTNATTIPQYFKENDYISIGMGKVFHPGSASGEDDKEYSWSPEGLPYYHSPLHKDFGPPNKTSLWWAFDGFEDNQLPDGQIADRATETLQKLKANRTKGDNRPFFLAVGFHKPHVPLYAPKKYFDMYPPASEIILPSNPHPPKFMPMIAWSTWKFWRDYKNTKAYFEGKNCTTNFTSSVSKECAFPDNVAQEIRRSYYASLTFTDYQVGKVLEELKRQGFAEDTVIVLLGDHGWQLGEHGEWAKYTNFEDATRVPLILHVPGVTDKGMRTKALVELVDVFPSLADVAGIPVPPLCPEGENNLLACVEGSSVAPLLKNSSRPWKSAAFSQYPRPGPMNGLPQVPRHSPFDHKLGVEQVMGYSVRSDQYRFTEWLSFNATEAKGNWTGGAWGVELYDHTKQTKNFDDENEDMYFNTGNKSIIEEHEALLRAGWRAAQPPSDSSDD